MAKLTGERDYTATSMRQVLGAFAFLNPPDDDTGAPVPATAAQLSHWIDRQVEGRVRKHLQKTEDAKSRAVVQAAVEAL